MNHRGTAHTLMRTHIHAQKTIHQGDWQLLIGLIQPLEVGGGGGGLIWIQLSYCPTADTVTPFGSQCAVCGEMGGGGVGSK